MGFVEGKDYTKQLSETTSDGKRKRTDFIIYLPDNRQVIIDSKVSLTAWEKYVNAQTEDEAELAIKEHCNSIKNHAKGLASKRYQDMEQINSVEFVLMFVPLESAFGAAMRKSPELYMDLAGNVNVKVVTGATIMTALLLIKDMWKREHQSRNQVKLIEQAGGLHDQIILFLESFQKIGTEIGQAKDAYDKSFERLVEGRGNVLRRTEGLKQLGAKVKKSMDQNLLEEGQYNHENATSSNEEE
jgi:DNA recombination protein RmuC